MFQVPNGQQTFLDINGQPLAGGTVLFYEPGTTTFKNTWLDDGLTVLNTNPITLDQAGRATVWGDGLYRQIVLDQFGNLQWDAPTGQPPVIGPGGFSTINTTGDASIGGALTVNSWSVFNGTGQFNGLLTAQLGLAVYPRQGLDQAAMISGDVRIDSRLNGITVNSALMDTTVTPNLPMWSMQSAGQLVQITGPHDIHQDDPSAQTWGGFVISNLVDPTPSAWGRWAGYMPPGVTPGEPVLPAPPVVANQWTGLTVSVPSMFWGAASTQNGQMAGYPLLMLSHLQTAQPSGATYIFVVGYPVAQSQVDMVVTGDLIVNGNITNAAATGPTIPNNLTINGSGVIYAAFGTHAIGFNWTGTGLDIMVDGSRVGSVTIGP